MAKVVTCPCGERITGDTDDELVRLVQTHGKEVHSQEVSREDALGVRETRLASVWGYDPSPVAGSHEQDLPFLRTRPAVYQRRCRSGCLTTIWPTSYPTWWTGHRSLRCGGPVSSTKVLLYGYCVGVASSRRTASQDIANFQGVGGEQIRTSGPSPTFAKIMWIRCRACSYRYWRCVSRRGW